MKIVGFETIRAEELENLLWLQVETDEGIVGLGARLGKEPAHEMTVLSPSNKMMTISLLIYPDRAPSLWEAAELEEQPQRIRSKGSWPGKRKAEPLCLIGSTEHAASHLTLGGISRHLLQL